MTPFQHKIRRIFLPFLWIAIAFIAFYTFLNWLMVIKLNKLHLTENWTQFILPLFLPSIPIFIWLRSRIKLLRLKSGSGRGDPVMAYIFIATLAIGVPAMIMQRYIESATGKLINLTNIGDINHREKVKYYTVQNYIVQRELARTYLLRKVTGKSGQHLDFYLYVAVPLYNKKQWIAPPGISGDDTLPTKIGANPGALPDSVGNVADEVNKPQPDVARAWLCLKYDTEVSNRLSQDEKTLARTDFLNRKYQDFEQRKIDGFVYLDRPGNNEDRDGYEKAIRYNNKSGYITPSSNVFEPRYESFDKRNGNKLAWTFGSFGIGAAVFLIMILIPGIKQEEAQTTSAAGKGLVKELKEMFSLLVPGKIVFATPVLIDLNILVFLLMVIAGAGFISFGSADLLSWGADYKPYIQQGQWWRLLTNIFLHGGIFHLFFNMAGLFFVGVFLEPVLGKTRFLIYYLACGICASITSVWYHDASVSVGASGAIFGLYGIFLALLTVKIFPPDFKKAFLGSTILFVCYNLLMGLSGNIDNAAHIGGFISGLIIGYISYPYLKEKVQEQQG